MKEEVALSREGIACETLEFLAAAFVVGGRN